MGVEDLDVEDLGVVEVDIEVLEVEEGIMVAEDEADLLL
jgi:hypothetical protein